MYPGMGEILMFDKEDRKNLARGMSLLSQLGITALVCVALGVLIGIGLDRWLNTTPVFIIIFSVIGIVTAIRTMVNIAKRM